MLKTLRSILTVAVTSTLLITSAFAGAIEDLAKGEFSLSTLSEKDRIKELEKKENRRKNTHILDTKL